MHSWRLGPSSAKMKQTARDHSSASVEPQRHGLGFRVFLQGMHSTPGSLRQLCARSCQGAGRVIPVLECCTASEQSSYFSRLYVVNRPMTVPTQDRMCFCNSAASVATATDFPIIGRGGVRPTGDQVPPHLLPNTTASHMNTTSAARTLNPNPNPKPNNDTFS